MFKFIRDFFGYKQFFNIKGFGAWLNSSIKNRAIFVYSTATFSIFVRYCLYSLHHNCWLPDFVTFYSALFSYSCATICLLIFGVLKSVTLGDLIRGFIDIGRIHENKIRNKKFRELVAETHNAHNSFKVYSRNQLVTFAVSFFLLSASSGTSAALHISICVLLYNIWVLFNILYFAWCIHLTPVPENLKTIRPCWLVKWDNFNDSLILMNGAGNVINESVTGSGLGKKILGRASKAVVKSFHYVTDSKNTLTIISGLVAAGGIIAGVDYTSAEASHRTSYATRAFEVNENGTYSPDPDTRVKAAALRRRGVGLLDCCEPDSRRLNPELVENKYGEVKPYETKRYLALEEKASALERENRKLRLDLEDPGLK